MNMKSFTRTKIINGIEYVYEITPYYDPQTKKVRQKSKYIGKKIEGVVKKVREKKVSSVFSYGELLPALKIISDYKLDNFLEKILGKKQAASVIAISLARLIKGLSLNHVADWYESTWLYHQHGELPLSSSSVSRLLSFIGEQRLQDKLASHLIAQLKSKRTIFYDITSVSSYSELIRLLEWGYNRDGMDLPQVNLSIILDKEEGIPLSYEIYPGSINDVVTLQNTMVRLRSMGVDDFSLVLDRGFFSVGNIELLMEHSTDFIMAVPERYHAIEKIISRLTKEIEKPRYLKKFNDEILFVKETEIQLGNHPLKVFCYYNPSRAQEEKDSFYKRLFHLKEQIERLKVDRGIRRKIADITQGLENYFSIHIHQGQLQVEIKEKAVARRLNRKGIYLIAYHGNYSWDTCLTMYKEKELIEKSFNFLKNDLEFTTPHIHKDSTLKGLMFISLIALIIRMKILNVLKQSNLQKDYSFEKMMIQLEKLKAIQLENDQIIITELTKKQKELLQPFNIVPKG
jgi:transposase